MKVAAFSCGKKYPSARVRVRQFIPELAAQGIMVHEFVAPIYKHHQPRWHHPAWLAAIRVARPAALIPSVTASHAFKASWIQKEMIWGRDSLERFTKGPRFFDVDDALWAETPHSAKSMASLARRVDVVMAGNETIANWFEPHAHEVRIVPTAVDTNGFTPGPARRLDEPFTIVWSGSKATLYHLATAEEALSIFMRRHPEVRFRAIGDVAPELPRLPADRFDFVPWSPSVEVDGIQAADVGIMPLVDDPNGRAKCAFKMLQYMSCGKPSVVTPIGLNVDILRRGKVGIGAQGRDEWIDALELLYNDREQMRAMGTEGRRVAQAEFDRSIVARLIGDLFREFVGAG